MYKILFLEDELDLVEDLPVLLRESKLEVIGTASIPKALNLVANEKFDAVLLDIQMPPMEDMNAEAVGYGRETGIEVARRIKVIEPAVPIVALTVVTDSRIHAKMQEAGIIKIISKPSEVEQIAQTLLRVISQA